MSRSGITSLLGIVLWCCSASAALIDAVQVKNTFGQATAGMYVVTATGVGIGDVIDATYVLTTPGGGTKPLRKQESAKSAKGTKSQLRFPFLGHADHLQERD